MKKISLLSLIIGLTTIQAMAQLTAQEYATGMFRGTRVINGQSVETLQEGEMEFIIAHRFGRINGGGYELFGLDQATIRIGLDYGLNNRLMVGFGRSSQNKIYDGYVKARLLRQGADNTGFPFSVTAFSSAAATTLRAPSPEEPIPFQSRWSFANQLLIARKFTDRFSLQIMPTHIHYNLVDTRMDKNDIFSVGIAGKYQLTKMWGFTAEYYHNLPNQLPANRQNSLAIGLDLNTGSHVFQLHFTNSSAMIEEAFIGKTTGNWGKGDIHFGFNMVRTFKLKGRRY